MQLSDHSTASGVTTSEATALAPGDLLSERFKLERVLGEGSVGEVWLAHDIQLDGEPVACKVLRAELVEHRTALTDLKREVLLSRKLRHPNILAVYTFRSSGAHHYITMEFIDGTDLATALLERDRPFSVSEILPWFRQIADALDYAHGQGVLHRDIKPANLLLTSDGELRVADFGIASLALAEEERTGVPRAQGTLYYISPEQLTGERLDARADVYSLAATIYQLLSGSPPFRTGEVIAQIQIKPPEPIDHLGEDLNRVILKALSKQPAKRPKSCIDFYAELYAAARASNELPPPREEIFMEPEDQRTEVIEEFSVGSRRMRLGRLLIQEGVIDQLQLADALIEQRQTDDRLGSILVRLGMAEAGDVAAMIARQLQLPLSSLENEPFDEDLRSLLPDDELRELACVPVRRTKFGVVFAMADPLDLETINELEDRLGESLELIVATEADILHAIDRAHD